MKKQTAYLIAGVILSTLCAKGAYADVVNPGKTLLDRDATYEQDLRWESSADKAITPAKVIRWMMSMRGEQVSAPSRTEFVPIFNTHDGQTRVIAAIAYKF